MAAPRALKPGALFRRCDPKSLPFKTTAELEDLDQVLGQDRAIEAVEFGAGIKRDGYNLLALGAAGTGRHSVIGEFLRRRAATESVPSDWCYINNFADPQKPRALELPAGRARPLKRDMSRLVDELKSRYQSRLVVFDLAPVFSADDALAFAPHVDAALLVVDDGRTTQNELTGAMQFLSATNVLGTVLNRAENALVPYTYY